MNWQVTIKKQVLKQMLSLPNHITDMVYALKREIETSGPLRHNWKNFGKIKGTDNIYHCHIKNGKPTYVACWEVQNKQIKIVEVYYVGTHEKAPY